MRHKAKRIFLVLALFWTLGTLYVSAEAIARQYHIGQAVMVEWRGTWYDAHVIGFGIGCTMIHYDGYSSSWDECVGEHRIRPR